MYLRALKTAVEAAQKAGSFLIEKVSTEVTIETKALNDFVTNVDKESESLIISLLQEDFPEFGILAEEQGAKPHFDKTPYWVIDPLDGTTNFIHRFPIFAVSIGLCVGKQPVLGAVYDPNRKELFTAIQGEGAFLNGQRINVSTAHLLQHSLIGTGFPFRNIAIIDQYQKCFAEILKRTHGIRRAGVASLDLCYLACGRLDGFWEHGLQPWDAAAGTIIIQEAGGKVTDFLNRDEFLFGRTMTASNGIIHEELQKIVSSTMPLQYPY